MAQNTSPRSPLLDLEENVNAAQQDTSDQTVEAFNDKSRPLEENISKEKNTFRSETTEQGQITSQSGKMEKDKITPQCRQLEQEPDGVDESNNYENIVIGARNTSTGMTPASSASSSSETRNTSTGMAPASSALSSSGTRNTSTGMAPASSALSSSGTRNPSTGMAPASSKFSSSETRNPSTGTTQASSAFGLADLVLALSHKAKLEKAKTEQGGERVGGETLNDNETFNGNEDEDKLIPDSKKSKRSPKKKRKGLTWITGVDHSKLGDMMKEIGCIGERKNSDLQENSKSEEGPINTLQTKLLFVEMKEFDRGEIATGDQQSNILRTASASWKSKRASWWSKDRDGDQQSNFLGKARPSFKSKRASWWSKDRDGDQQSNFLGKARASFKSKRASWWSKDRGDTGDQHKNILGTPRASWKSKARWIKFEENWEEGADRWSKPHIASLTFSSLPQLRRSLENGLIMLNVTETSLPCIFNIIVDGLVKMELIEAENKESVLRMLRLNGTGNKKPRENWRGLQGNMGAVRRAIELIDMARRKSRLNSLDSKLFTTSATEISRRNTSDNSTHSKLLPASTTNMSRRNTSYNSFDSKSSVSNTSWSNNFVYYSSDEVHLPILESINESMSKNNNNSPMQQTIPQEGIMSTLPEDAEGAMVMVATEDSLKNPVAALVRLVNPPVLDNFLEAPVPLRFIFFLVGPDSNNAEYQEVGRAMATLFTNDIFRDMAYAAIDKHDLLNGINEFLNDTLVLPPGNLDKDLLLPIIARHQKRNREKVAQRQSTLSPLQMTKDAKANTKISLETQKHTDPLERTGRLFGGLINDIKRRIPHYKSDIIDGINFQCLASFVFIYFACLSPAISFGGLLGKKTDHWMGVSEMIVSTSLCGMIFALFSGQPLVVIGGTGPVLMFEEYLYKFCKEIDLDFMAFRTWIGFWICVLAIIVVMCEGSVLVRHFTRFTEEIFSTVIAGIFIYETVKGLQYITCESPILADYCLDEVNATAVDGSHGSSSNTHSDTHLPKTGHAHGSDYYEHDEPYHCFHGNTTHHDDHVHKKGHHGCSPSKYPHPNTALFAIILTFGTFFISFFLRIFRYSPYLGRTARKVLGNFGIAIAIIAMVALAYLMEDIYIDTITIMDASRPTDPCKRGWLINPFGQQKELPVWAAFGAIVPAFFVFILLYMETLLIGMVVNKESNKLRKGSGYHLDLFLIGILSALAGLMGVPWMCAAPLRTVSHISSLTVLTRKNPPGVKPKLDHIKDQRVTNFAVSLLIGLSNLLAPLLQEIPIAALLGVFLYLGVTSLSGLEFIERLKILFMPQKHHPDVKFTRTIKLWKMNLFTIIQVVCVILFWVIKNSIIALAFPFFLILLVFIRILLKYFFSEQELEVLDSEEDDEEDLQDLLDCNLG